MGGLVSSFGWICCCFLFPSVLGVMGEDGKAIGGVGGGELLLPPAPVEEQEGVREAMQLAAELCKHFYSQGWVSGTGGSITLKVHNPLVPLSERLIVMAPSGRVCLSHTHTHSSVCFVLAKILTCFLCLLDVKLLWMVVYGWFSL